MSVSPAGPTRLRSLRELRLGKPAQGDWGRCEGRLPPAHCLPDKNSPTTLGLRVGMTLTLGGCKEVRGSARMTERERRWRRVGRYPPERIT